MVTIISQSPAETLALGRDWGSAMAERTVVALSGDLGAGKTQLVRGIAAGLGCAGRVTSPTFALLHEYHGGRLPLFHLDLYRLESPAEVAGAGLEDYLVSPAGVTVVEWAERWFVDMIAGPVAANPTARTEVAGFPGAGSAPEAGWLRRVWLEVSGGEQRKISYADSRA
ncbi:MAG: tRNA (adenosine(37)-N6)-threonylcarbamoyltransferase complex ATPase subunit type 1 TsaE [Verrucomicrobiales bacterium]|nr:tRNA (adenosine(37)-N6)-threonylcarbamoyltransferase complex ATPase subunit type 1 TsaE [Verrucomicrobiales bacterium]